MKKLALLFIFLLLALPSQGLSNQTAETSTCEDGKISLSEKPEICPCCGESTIAKIIYGMPYFSDELKKEINEGKVYLIGCPLSGEPADWICTACKKIFYDK